MERRGVSERWARKKSHLQSRSGDFEGQVLGRVGNRGQAKSWRADGHQGVSGIIFVVASSFLWVASQGGHAVLIIIVDIDGYSSIIIIGHEGKHE